MKYAIPVIIILLALLGANGIYVVGEGHAALVVRYRSQVAEFEVSDTGVGIPAGELDRVYYMRESLMHDVVAIGRAMNERGWILQIEDCFRTL